MSDHDFRPAFERLARLQPGQGYEKDWKRDRDPRRAEVLRVKDAAVVSRMEATA